jgi:cytochrome c2
MNRSPFVISFALILVILLAGCTVQDTLAFLSQYGGQVTAEPLIGDAARGETLYKTGFDGAPACTSCHPAAQGAFTIGPVLKGVYQRAATRLPGLSAEQYLHQSIVDPKAYTVPGYRPIMYSDYAAHFSEQQIADLIAYLRTL